MACEHGECGCNHDHQVEATEGQQAEEPDASAGCCGGHHGRETTRDDRLEVGRGA